MAITARPFKPNNVKGKNPEKKKPLDKRAVLALLLLLLIGGLGYSFWPNGRIQAARKMQQTWDTMSDEDKNKLSKDDREYLWAQFQLNYNGMTPSKRRPGRTNARPGRTRNCATSWPCRRKTERNISMRTSGRKPTEPKR